MGNFGLIDLDTPKEAYTKADYVNGKTWELVFSDEFNVDGRTFYPGDDPYWEAVDLHYWGTNDLEWYDPAAITTANGSLEITFSSKYNASALGQHKGEDCHAHSPFKAGTIASTSKVPHRPDSWPKAAHSGASRKYDSHFQ